ncbi:hypothetical protein GCM10028864_34910 [Microlunatus parietis]
MVVSIGLLVVGATVAVVCGLLGLTGPEVALGPYAGFLFGYAFATVGLSILLQTVIDSATVPAIVCGAAALLLAGIVLARREAMDLVEVGAGSFVVACIAWWAYQSFRRQRGRAS